MPDRRQPGSQRIASANPRRSTPGGLDLDDEPRTVALEHEVGLGWLWVVAAASPDGTVTFLDPTQSRTRKGVNLPTAASIANLLAWVDDVSSTRSRR